MVECWWCSLAVEDTAHIIQWRTNGSTTMAEVLAMVEVVVETGTDGTSFGNNHYQQAKSLVHFHNSRSEGYNASCSGTN